MYKELLTIRYFRRKLIALFAVLAVLMCTAMVITVSSVMGGFLELLREAGKSMVGDVIVQGPLSGFPHYDEIIKRIENAEINTPDGKVKAAIAATPVIRTYGLLKLSDNDVYKVEIHGIDGDGQSKVTGYSDNLFWTQDKLKQEKYQRYQQHYGDANLKNAGTQFKNPWNNQHPVIVPGLEVSRYNYRDKDGSYFFNYASGFALPKHLMTLSVLPISSKGNIDTLNTETKRFIVANEYMSGLYAVDSNRVYISFDEAQQMAHMESAKRVKLDEQGNPVFDDNGSPIIEGEVPARCNDIYVKAAPGITPDQLKKVVEKIYTEVQFDHNFFANAYVMTWEESQRHFIAGVEKEKGLVTILFAIISLVAVFMVGVIFYMIVLDKTKDIGILRSIGASKFGTMTIFLYYGGVIGFTGAILGVGAALLIVKNINTIHDWLGNGMGASVFVAGCTLVVPLKLTIYWVIMRINDITVGRRFKYKIIASGVIGFFSGLIPVLVNESFAAYLNQKIGFVIWNRQIYFFDQIPSRVDPVEASVIFGIAILASIVGAIIPAFKASQVDPVNALRYE